jgi:hypothetical protein
MREVDTTVGLTRSGFLLVAVITVLSVAHHVDHVVRDSTGWPFDGGFNPFSASLFIYPVIALGVILSRAGRVGARFWAFLAGGAAVFVTAVHLGPGAGDAIDDIPGSYGSNVAGVLAVTVLGVFVGALVAHAVLEIQRLRHRDLTERESGAESSVD